MKKLLDWQRSVVQFSRFFMDVKRRWTNDRKWMVDFRRGETELRWGRDFLRLRVEFHSLVG